MIDLRMVATRQFGAVFLVMLATGAILLATTQFLPELVQLDFGYTATWAVLVLSPGGLVTIIAPAAIRYFGWILVDRRPMTNIIAIVTRPPGDRTSPAHVAV